MKLAYSFSVWQSCCKIFCCWKKLLKSLIISFISQYITCKTDVLKLLECQNFRIYRVRVIGQGRRESRPEEEEKRRWKILVVMEGSHKKNIAGVVGRWRGGCGGWIMVEKYPWWYCEFDAPGQRCRHTWTSSGDLTWPNLAFQWLELTWRVDFSSDDIINPAVL